MFAQRRRAPHRRESARWSVLIVAAALVLSVAVPANAVPPRPIVPLPGEVDLIDEYEGQKVCDPTPKPGTLKLRDALLQAYGSGIWTGISRDCNDTWDQGISEHKDGRAIDWAVNVRDATRAYGDEFAAWVIANGGEMARRLGIMYIVWDSRIWRTYGMQRGWTEYNSCLTRYTSPSYDTTCHRDHMHISMTWHGAAARTSWYDGTAVTTPGCRAGNPVTAQAGSPGAPSLIFDPLRGAGTAQRPCYLDQSIQTLKIGPGGGERFVQRIRISDVDINAPTYIRIWSDADSGVRIDRSAPNPGLYDVLVGGDGLLYVQTHAGQASIRIEGLGSTARDRYEAFVAQAYRDVLGREADPGGLRGWTNAVMDGGVSRQGMTMGFIRSTEGSQRIARSFYRDILGREPDAGGLSNWTRVMSQGTWKVKDARRGFWISAERLARSGSIEQWVADLYLGELGRSVDPRGLASWSSVARSQGPGAAAAGIMGSREWLHRQVAAQYALMLKRPPDSGGLSSWSTVLQRTDIPVVQSSLGGSYEYFVKAPQ